MTHIVAHEKVTIGNDVQIGENVVIIHGVSIVDGSIKGGNSVITKDISANSMVIVVNKEI